MSIAVQNKTESQRTNKKIIQLCSSIIKNLVLDKKTIIILGLCTNYKKIHHKKKLVSANFQKP